MQQYQNTDAVFRRWDLLFDPATGATLGLEAGEVTENGVGMWVTATGEDGEPDRNVAMVRGELPADFGDLYLKPVAAKVSRRTADPPADPPADPATTDAKSE